MSLANGNLVALDQETGEALWTFETGLPLVSATPPSGEAGVEEVNNGEDTKPKDSIFPGIDGSLYAYRPSHGSDGSRIEVGGPVRNSNSKEGIRWKQAARNFRSTVYNSPIFLGAMLAWLGVGLHAVVYGHVLPEGVPVESQLRLRRKRAAEGERLGHCWFSSCRSCQ